MEAAVTEGVRILSRGLQRALARQASNSNPR
jgi:hypothetical protein